MSKLEKLVALATIMSSLSAAVALIWNVKVFDTTSVKNEMILNTAIKSQKENASLELYQSYLSLAFLYPDFAFDKIDIRNLPEPEGKNIYSSRLQH